MRSSNKAKLQQIMSQLPAGSQLVRSTEYFIDDEHLRQAAEHFKLQPRWVIRQFAEINQQARECRGIMLQVMNYVCALPGMQSRDATAEWTSTDEVLH